MDGWSFACFGISNISWNVLQKGGGKSGEMMWGWQPPWLIVDMKKERRPHHPLVIWELQIPWDANQQLYFLMKLRKFAMLTEILRNFHRCNVKRIYTSCITVWYGSATVMDHKHLHRVRNKFERFIRTPLPTLQYIYNCRVYMRVASIVKDPYGPKYGLFTHLIKEQNEGILASRMFSFPLPSDSITANKVGSNMECLHSHC